MNPIMAQAGTRADILVIWAHHMPYICELPATIYYTPSYIAGTPASWAFLIGVFEVLSLVRAVARHCFYMPASLLVLVMAADHLYLMCLYMCATRSNLLLTQLLLR
jgi:hypothetical protein